MFDGRRAVIDKLGDPDPILLTAFLSDNLTASLSRLKYSSPIRIAELLPVGVTPYRFRSRSGF